MKSVEQEIAELVPAETFTDIVKKLEANDVETQTLLYMQIVDVESMSIVSQLRHRAEMMRLRANEFDAIADGIVKATGTLVNYAGGFEKSHRDALELIQRHAHIQPTKVT